MQTETLRPTLLAIISELVLWTAIVLVAIGVGYLFMRVTADPDKTGGQTIIVHFKDVNQLSVGSPVNFMGTNVGFVTAMRPKKNKVEVTLRTFVNAPPIPRGSRFTVEFNSLAGAKSLEILPNGQSEDDTLPGTIYIEEEPIRLKDVTNTQMVMSKALDANARNFARTLGRVEDEQALYNQLVKVNDQILGVNDSMLNVLSQAGYGSTRMHVMLSGTQGTLESLTPFFDAYAQRTGSPQYRQEVLGNLRGFANEMAQFANRLDQFQRKRYFDRIEPRVARFAQSMAKANATAQDQVPLVLAQWYQANQSLGQTNRFLARIDNGYLQGDTSQVLQGLKQRIAGLNTQLGQLNNKPEPQPNAKKSGWAKIVAGIAAIFFLRWVF